MRSVADQRGVDVEHIVLGDACPHLSAAGVAYSLATRYGALVQVVRDDATDYRPARTAVLRNLGVQLARGRFIAHLDDDNELESDHLATLVDAIAPWPEAAVAYSWRQLLDSSGAPVELGGMNPWFAEPGGAHRSYEELMAMGVFTPDSHIMRDRPLGPAGEALYLVDTSEMLIPVEIACEMPFRTRYTSEDQAANLCEDRAFVADALNAGIRFIPSRRATLRYRLGGYSNGWLPVNAR